MKPINNGIDEKLFKYLVANVDSTPFYHLLGIKIKCYGLGIAELYVGTEEKHTNPLEIIHGGLLMSLADAAMGNAIRTTGIKGVTVDYSTSFMGTAPLGEIIICRGQVIKSGRNIIFARADTYYNDKLIAESRGTFFKTGIVEFSATGGNMSE